MQVRRVSCPQCETMYAIAADGGTTGLRCAHCGQVWPEPGPVSGPASILKCTDHPGRMAAWACDGCGKTWCAACTPARRLERHAADVSPCCNDHCTPVGEPYRPEPFWTRPGGILLYPVHPKGLLIFTVIGVLWFIPFLNWILMLLFAGFLIRVLVTSAGGSNHLPDFPEFKDVWQTIVVPLFLMAISFAVAFLPLILYAVYRDRDLSGPAVWPLGIYGLLVFPVMAMTTAVTGRAVPALNPANLFRIVRAIPRTYLVLVAWLTVILGLFLVLRSFLAGSIPQEILRVALDLYALFLVFHLLGRAIHQTRAEVDWNV